MNTLIIGFVVIILLLIMVICYMVYTLEKVAKLVKASSLSEYMDLVENDATVYDNPEVHRFKDITDLTAEELSGIDIDPSDNYRGLIFKEDETTNTKENLIS